MRLVLARRSLVGSAVVLLVGGVVVDLPGVARAALLAAAGCCALLDAVAVRTAGSTMPPRDVVTVPITPLSTDDPRVDGRKAPDAPVPVDAAAAAGGVRATADDDTGGLLLGRRPDGRPVRAGGTPCVPCHVVVLGTGALARAVFEAVSAQLERLGTTASEPEVRAASDRAVGTQAPRGARPLPTGTAVTVRVGSDGRAAGTAVLVPGADLLPRRWDHLVEVTRYGCRSSARGDPTPSPIEPVLPLVEHADAGPVAR